MLVATAVEANRSALTAAGLALDIALPDEPVLVDVDATRAVQVVSNVLHNAVKFTDAGGRIGITAAREAARRRGRGAHADDHRLGRRHHGRDAAAGVRSVHAGSDRASHAGLGIGLALARRLVELHGGTIDAHSDGPGRGSVFTIRLPVSQPTSAAPAPAKARRRPRAGGGSS